VIECVSKFVVESGWGSETAEPNNRFIRFTNPAGAVELFGTMGTTIPDQARGADKGAGFIRAPSAPNVVSSETRAFTPLANAGTCPKV